MGSFLYLLKGAKVVHPVELGLFFDLVVASNEYVALEWSFAKRLSHFRSNELGSALYIRLMTCSKLDEGKISHNKVGKVDAVSLLT